MYKDSLSKHYAWNQIKPFIAFSGSDPDFYKHLHINVLYANSDRIEMPIQELLLVCFFSS